MSKRVFHFSLGDSTNTGAVGFCANIVADSPEDAVERLRRLMPDDQSVPIDGIGRGKHSEEYIHVYFNPDSVTVRDIDDEYNLPETGDA